MSYEKLSPGKPYQSMAEVRSRQSATSYPYDIYSYELVVPPAYFKRDRVSCSVNAGRHFLAGVYSYPDDPDCSGGSVASTAVSPNSKSFDLHPLSRVYSTWGWNTFSGPGYETGYAPQIPGFFNCPSGLCDPDPLRFTSDMQNVTKNKCNYRHYDAITNLTC